MAVGIRRNMYQNVIEVKRNNINVKFASKLWVLFELSFYWHGFGFVEMYRKDLLR